MLTNKITNFLISLRSFPSFRFEIDIKSDLKSSLLESKFEKSIYSRSTLDENSIKSYKTAISSVVNMWENIKILLKFKNLIFKLDGNTSRTLPNDFRKSFLSQGFISENNIIFRLGNKLESQNLIDIKIIINEYIDADMLKIKGLLEDELYNLIKDDKDEYLKLSRRIYIRRIKECQNEILNTIKNTNLKIYVTEIREIVIKESLINERSSKHTCLNGNVMKKQINNELENSATIMKDNQKYVNNDQRIIKKRTRNGLKDSVTVKRNNQKYLNIDQKINNNELKDSEINIFSKIEDPFVETERSKTKKSVDKRRLRTLQVIKKTDNFVLYSNKRI